MRLLMGVFAATAMVLVSGCNVTTSENNSSANTTGENISGNSDVISGNTEKSNWSYSEDKDEMRGVTTKVATTESVEAFPNAFGMGSQPTELAIQKRSNGKIEVSIDNQNLQYTCNSFTNTYVSLKFDNGGVVKYSCTDAVGDKYGVAFITPGLKILQRLKSSKKLIVETEVFQRGYVQQTFDVAGLKI